MPDPIPWSSSHRIRCYGQNPGQNAPPRPWGCRRLPRSHDDPTPSSPPLMPQAVRIRSDHTQPGPMGLILSHPKVQPKPWSEQIPMSLRMCKPSKITWTARDDHATTCHPGHLIGRPPSQQTWDLRVPTLFLCNLFLSYCILMLL